MIELKTVTGVTVFYWGIVYEKTDSDNDGGTDAAEYEHDSFKR